MVQGGVRGAKSKGVKRAAGRRRGGRTAHRSGYLRGLEKNAARWDGIHFCENGRLSARGDTVKTTPGGDHRGNRLDASACYRVSDDVVVRPEPAIGCLLYDRSTSRVFLLPSPIWGDFLQAMDGSRPLDWLLKEFASSNLLDSCWLPRFLDVLDKLVRSNVLIQC